jgi:peptidyl-prolyl cis-trans isomerase B (cyclophilin B)
LLKRIGAPLLCCAALALQWASAAPAPPNPYVEIVQLEKSRSLGNGRLAALLDGGDRRLALRAALAIGRTKRPAGIPLLERRASGGDPSMRAMAVYGIGLIGGAAAARPVLRALEDTTELVRVSALDATDRLETARSLPAHAEVQAERIAARLLAGSGAIQRATAAVALESFSGSTQSQRALGALVRAERTERNARVRGHEMWALYRGYAKAAPERVFLRGLRDGNEIVRIEAVRGLGKRGERNAIPDLSRLLADPSWRVREQTLESLKVLRGGAMTEHLKAIPAGIVTPAPQRDPFAAIPALPRSRVSGKPAPPSASAIITAPALVPATAAAFTGPAQGSHPLVRIVTTQGNLYVELYPEWAPLTVENFLDLANRGYYDGNRWFRIVPDFVVQTGDKTNTGNGDAGYTIANEENPIEQNSYVVSMGLNYTNPPNAHAIRDSAGTQFYITLSPQFHLDNDFTVFGKVTSGFDVLGRLVESDKILRIDRLPDMRS